MSYIQYPIFNPSNIPSVTNTETLQQSYVISPPTEITTNSANGALTIQTGVLDSSNCLEIKNLAGSNTATIKGNSYSETKISYCVSKKY